MATFVRIDTTNQYGREVISALKSVSTGIAVLKKLDGIHLEAIAKGNTEMANVFGVDTAVNAQELSDRWVNFLAAYDNAGNTEYGKLRDLLNAVLEQ